MRKHLFCFMVMVLVSACVLAQARPQPQAPPKPKTPVATPARPPAPAVMHAPVLVQISAGSPAPYGTDQNLTIDSLGHCSYYMVEVGGGVRDSAQFNISIAQLDTLLGLADAKGFFALNHDYRKGFDGAGIFIAMAYHGKTNDVELVNMDRTEINALVAWLNERLAAHRIRIYYGQRP